MGLAWRRGDKTPLAEKEAVLFDAACFIIPYHYWCTCKKIRNYETGSTIKIKVNMFKPFQNMFKVLREIR